MSDSLYSYALGDSTKSGVALYKIYKVLDDPGNPGVYSFVYIDIFNQQSLNDISLLSKQVGIFYDIDTLTSNDIINTPYTVMSVDTELITEYEAYTYNYNAYDTSSMGFNWDLNDSPPNFDSDPNMGKLVTKLKVDIPISSFVMFNNNYGYIYIRTNDRYSSFSVGSNNISGGISSFSEGQNTRAIGNYSHSEGLNTESIGPHSHSEGYNSSAYGKSSHVEGRNTRAHGEASHSEGKGSESWGMSSHAEGESNKSYGDSSHAEGKGNRSYGVASHAEGKDNESHGFASHVEGMNSKSIGNISHAEGNSTLAKGSISHAEGLESISRGSNSHSQNSMTYAYGENSHAEGHESKSGIQCYQINQLVYTYVDGERVTIQTSQEVLFTESTYFYFNSGQGNVDYLYRGDDIIYNNFNSIDNIQVIGLSTPNVLSSFIYINYFTTALPIVSLDKVIPLLSYRIFLSGDAVSLFYDQYPSSPPYKKISLSTNDIYSVGYYTDAISIDSIIYDSDGNLYGLPDSTVIEVTYTLQDLTIDVYKSINIINSLPLLPRSNYTTLDVYLEPHHTNSVKISAGSYLYFAGAVGDTEPSHLLRRTSDLDSTSTFFPINNYEIIGDRYRINIDLPYRYAYDRITIPVEPVNGKFIKEGQYLYILNTRVSNSHAEGSYTLSGNNNSHAEGDKTLANGESSHAEGIMTESAGIASHAEGEMTLASGEASHAEGINSQSVGRYSHAEGYSTVAVGEASHAGGVDSLALHKGEFAISSGKISTTGDSQLMILIFTYSGSNPDFSKGVTMSGELKIMEENCVLQISSKTNIIGIEPSDFYMNETNYYIRKYGGSIHYDKFPVKTYSDAIKPTGFQLSFSGTQSISILLVSDSDPSSTYTGNIISNVTLMISKLAF